MPKLISMQLTDASIKNAIKEVNAYKEWVLKKETELRLRLAQRGATVASIKFAGAIYDGVNDVTVHVDDTGSTAVIYAEGSAVLFIEFGSGATLGGGHPEADKHGYGPGTWSTNEGVGGKGHWDDPDGWYYEHGKKSHGNPPAMAMWSAAQSMAEELTMIAKEVFSQ